MAGTENRSGEGGRDRNRVSARFAELAEKGERALICYVVAGYPDFKTAESVIGALAAGGADIIEIGIPFSDPIADGPTIQAASNISLKKGMTPEKALALAKAVRMKYPSLPILAMTYYNILVRAGVEKFMSEAKSCGVDGFILPDLPVEEADDYVKAASRLGLATVFLASPNTSPDRLDRIVRSTTGFVYLVSVFGITGARRSFEDDTASAIRSTKGASAGSGVPVAVGFGISAPDHARFMIDAGADAVIVGSAIIDRINKKSVAGSKQKKAKMLKGLTDFARSMKGACRTAGSGKA